MAKMVMYRNNSAYEKFLAPCIVGREGFEMQVFPQGTPAEEITAWIAEYADRIRSMEKVYMDRTCYEAGESVPSIQEGAGCSWNIWMDVQTNYGQFDYQVFHEAIKVVVTKATVEETIAEIIRLMLQREVPSKVHVVRENMGDHDLFGSLSKHGDRERAAQEDAEQLRVCLEKVTGIPVTIGRFSTQYLGGTEGNPWVFFDRHNSLGQLAHKRFAEGIESAECFCQRLHWSTQTRLFRLPIENLIEDAYDFGVAIDPEAYSQKIREIVAAW